MLTRFNESIWGDEGFSAILSMKSLPEIIKTIHSVMFQRGGEVSIMIVFIISGRDFIERMALKPSSPQRLTVNWLGIKDSLAYNKQV